MNTIRLIVVFLLVMSCSKNKDRIVPEERTLTESVYSSVTIQPDSLYQVYAIVAGLLDKNLVEEGDLVFSNTPLIQIINNTPKLNAQNARLALELAKENFNGSAAILNGIKDEIRSAKLKLKNDSTNFYRQKNLWEQQIGSKIEYDTKKLSYELASNNLNLILSNYDRTKNELYTTVRKAQNSYQTSLITTKDFTVKSKIQGKVYALYKEPGEIVTTMEPLASIGSATNFIVKMLVDEVDIIRISKHQKVIISLDAYEGKVFIGEVSKIYPKKDERNQTFMVEAIFKEAPNKLYPGLSGEANIIIAEKRKVLTIPKNYLVDDTKVRTASGLVTITIGLQNMDYIEVLSGVTKDTYIYKP